MVPAMGNLVTLLYRPPCFTGLLLAAGSVTLTFPLSSAAASSSKGTCGCLMVDLLHVA